MIKHLKTLDEFKKETAEGTVLVDFFATWCGPCRMLAPVLEEVDEENLVDAKIIKIDVDEAAELSAMFRIQVIPTLVLMKDGKEVKRKSAYMPKNAVVDFIKN